MGKQITIIVVLFMFIVGVIAFAGSYQAQQQQTPQQQIQILQQKYNTAKDEIGEQRVYARQMETVLAQRQQVINRQSQCLLSIIGFRSESANIDSVLKSYGM